MTSAGNSLRAHRFLFIICFFLLVLFPFLLLLLGSFSGRWPYPRVFPETLSFRGWHFVAESFGPILKSLGTSTLYSFCSALLSVVLCWYPAKFLARTRFPAEGVLEALLLSPALLPSISFSMGIQVVYIVIGISDTFAAVVLVLALTSYPYVLRSLKTGFLAFPSQYNECAANLGARHMQQLLQVELPVVLPSVFSGAFIAFLVAFSEYFLVFLIGGGRVAGYTGYLVPFITGSDRNVASVLTLLFLVVPLSLFLFQELFLRVYYSRKGIGAT